MELIPHPTLLTPLSPLPYDPPSPIPNSTLRINARFPTIPDLTSRLWEIIPHQGVLLRAACQSRVLHLRPTQQPPPPETHGSSPPQLSPHNFHFATGNPHSSPLSESPSIERPTYGSLSPLRSILAPERDSTPHQVASAPSPRTW